MSYLARIGQNLSICCPVSSYPPPVVTWEKNGTQLQEESKTVFTIILDNNEKFGKYSCSATDGKASIGPIVITVMEEICKYSLVKAHLIFVGLRVVVETNNNMICTCMIFGINTTRDISKLSQISLA